MRRSTVIMLVLGGLGLLFLLLAKAYLSGLTEGKGGRDLKPMVKALEKEFDARIKPGSRARLRKQGKELHLEVAVFRHQDLDLPGELGAAVWKSCRDWTELELVRISLRDPDTTVERHQFPRPEALAPVPAGGGTAPAAGEGR